MFFNRFVFKNPKSPEDKTGAHPTFGKRKFYKPKGVKTLPVNSKSYLNETEENIPVDELFLYSYLRKKYQNRPLGEEQDDDGSDLESVQSEEFEEMLDKMAGVKVRVCPVFERRLRHAPKPIILKYPKSFYLYM